MKPRPRKLYAVVSKVRPHISHLDIFADTDLKIDKTEEIWEVEVTAIRPIIKRTKKLLTKKKK